MNAEDIEVRITADGSTTLYRKDLDETYHSTHGALQEARHVFIEHGLAQLPAGDEIHILEIGFGTGLNALLTQLYAKHHELSIHYHGLEAFPLPEEIIGQVNYVNTIDDALAKTYFSETHVAPWDEEVLLRASFRLKKIHDTLQHFDPEENRYDLIYFDAFGPRAQEDMWHIDLLAKLHSALKIGGVLVTYCAKGSFKRDLKALGFEVVSLPGPPGKREMTRAVK
jgi:tRNA U34 5-methylaminomethyl-2-thiouridine-forming methyltransferase MnmC